MNNERSVLDKFRLRVSGFALMTIAFVVLCPILAWPQDETPSVVIQWNNAALQGVRDSKLGPPMVARALAIVHTCIYDAWAAYDQHALGTQLGGSLRQPPSQRSIFNKNKAISFAAYRAAVDLFPGNKATVFNPLWRPSDTTQVTCRQIRRRRAASGTWLAQRSSISATTTARTSWGI